MAKIKPKYLEGLKFHGAESKVVEKDGRKVQQNVPFERDLTADDVLDWKEKGDFVIIVTKDGRKYNVSKSGNEKKDENETI